MTAIIRRLALPACIFLGVAAIHCLRPVLLPVGILAEEQCAEGEVAGETNWFKAYVNAKDYWLGYSYALSLAFAAAALRRHRETRCCGARNLAIGGATLSGVVAVVGCYLLGCCGSPMLVVYASLLGTASLPFVKPVVAGLTTALTLVGFWWMRRYSRTCANVKANPCTTSMQNP